jgi:stage II sporulation protein R
MLRYLWLSLTVIVFDQGVKLAVRDAVLRQLDPGLARLTSYQRARAFLADHLPQLRQVVGAVLQADKTPYGDRVVFTRTWFPPKAYGSWVLPAGQYRALLVVLGAGQGHNWWCVLFPSLCFIDMNNGLAVPPTPRPPVNGHVSVSWRPPAAAGSPPPAWLRQLMAWW